MPESKPLHVNCCIAGGGPAGVMLGMLLARAGVETLVLEKHKDFLRDFRGDTVHPSTMEVLYELGLLEGFLARPHQEMRRISAQIGGLEVKVADFSHLPTHSKFIALMPQWDFLDFLTSEGRRYPTFQLRHEAEVTDLTEDQGKVTGVTVKSPEGDYRVTADLVVGADGRHSVVREKSGLEILDLGAPIDVLWLSVPRRSDDPPQSLGRVEFGRIFITLDRGDYWQCAYVIRKGSFTEIQARGLVAFQADIARLAPYLTDRVETLRDWEQVKLLTVTVDRLKQWWRPGLLCIGDSAHAMSPIGGVGINLAIQDAVAAANLLARPLRDRTLSTADLAGVQNRRLFPTRVTQGFQLFIQNRVMNRVLDSDKPFTAPWPMRLLNRFPPLRRLPARAVGMGVRPEHVRTEATKIG